MCGICGTVAVDGRLDPQAAEAIVDAMMQALAHRGHDDLGQRASGPGVLGATRLAIRGLQDGAQPMIDPLSGVIAACNGEIDNHHELRRWLADRGRPVAAATDVAVIPGLYLELGEEFASRLVGAFAVAVWDPAKQRLLLARDRVGERPLFFAVREGEVTFATELAALVSGRRLPVSLDEAALRSYLQFGIFPSPGAPFAEVRKVAPGETVRLDRSGAHRARYWRWNITGTRKQSASLETFDRVFREAVRRPPWLPRTTRGVRTRPPRVYGRTWFRVWSGLRAGI